MDFLRALFTASFGLFFFLSAVLLAEARSRIAGEVLASTRVFFYMIFIGV